MIITTKWEKKRGCGYRQPGGLYMCTDAGVMASCGKMPLRLTVCPTCDAGIKPARGWKWWEPKKFFASLTCPCDNEDNEFNGNYDCPMRTGYREDQPAGEALWRKQGLLWVGERFYPTPEDWLNEARAMGISRRVKFLPKDFVIGEHYVYVAHKRAIQQQCECVEKYAEGYALPDSECDGCGGTGIRGVAGVFFCFKPQRVEYVVKGDESKKKLKAMLDRDIELVEVVHVGEDDETAV